MRDNRFCAAAKRRTHAACIGYSFYFNWWLLKEPFVVKLSELS